MRSSFESPYRAILAIWDATSQAKDQITPVMAITSRYLICLIAIVVITIIAITIAIITIAITSIITFKFIVVLLRIFFGLGNNFSGFQSFLTPGAHKLPRKLHYSVYVKYILRGTAGEQLAYSDSDAPQQFYFAVLRNLRAILQSAKGYAGPAKLLTFSIMMDRTESSTAIHSTAAQP